jgi:hypothetical protein
MRLIVGAWYRLGKDAGWGRLNNYKTCAFAFYPARQGRKPMAYYSYK